MNFGPGVICAPVESVDLSRLSPTDYLWASPPCQAHSIARSKKLAARDDEGVDLMRSANWGFTYKSMIPWLKMTADAAPRVGLGFHVRGCAEYLLIGTRGHVPDPPVEKRISAVFNPIGRHSAKPDQQYDIAEAYDMGEGSQCLEMFARSAGDQMFGPRPRWTYIGNEIDGKGIRQALAELQAACQ